MVDCTRAMQVSRCRWNPTTNRNGASRSLWMATADPPVFAPLVRRRACARLHRRRRHRRPDHRLAPGASAGVDVIVLEEHDLHGGQTARTTGHLCDALDDRYSSSNTCTANTARGWPRTAMASAIDTIETHLRRRRHRLRLRARRRLPGARRRRSARRRCSTREHDAARRAGLDGRTRRGAARARTALRRGAALPATGALPRTRIPRRLARAIVRTGRAHPHRHARRCRSTAAPMPA